MAATAAAAVVVAGLSIWAPGARVVDDLARLLLSAALLGAGLLFRVHWQLTRWTSSAWLVLGATSTGAYLAVTNAARLLDQGVPARDGYLETAAFAALLGALGIAAGHRLTLDRHPSPMPAGLAIGALLSTAVVVLQATAAPPLPGSVVRWAATVVVLVAGSYLALVLHRRLGTAGATRVRVVGATVTVTAASAGRMLGVPLDALVAVLDVVAAALVLGAARSLTNHSIADHHRALDTLRSTVEENDDSDRCRQSALHEIRATLGGLAQAVQVLQQDGVPPHRRADLLRLVGEELQRLQRITEPRRTESAGPVDLDRALETVVLRQRLHGQEVLWQPSGHRAWARFDDVVGIVGTLLENSRVHAPGSVCLLEVVPEDPGGVAIRLSDTGRGVAPEMRGALFAWAARQASSSGQGIGLASARELARRNDGDLAPDHRPGRGAGFVLTLPSAGRALRLSPHRDARVHRSA